MNPRVIAWLACPVCGGHLSLQDPSPASEVEDGALACPDGHVFPIASGVPRLSPDDLLEEGRAAADSIRESFSHEWAHFEFGEDRTWGASVEQRREEFLRHVNLSPDELEGKRVLDAGCGNGSLSRAIASFGCDVLAADIGRQVVDAHRHFSKQDDGRTSYVQANLMHPPFARDAFDVVFCAGVLHHTPSTKATFDTLVPALAPGGTIFVWLYHHVPGRVLALKSKLRQAISRMPAPVKERLVKYVFLPQAMLRQYLRTALGRNEPVDRLKWRERLVILLDSYTPQYRWEHTPEELAGWYRELGFVDIEVTERGQWGFGVAARRPKVPDAVDAPAVTATV
jgi:SAM-dependent methyltransferase